MNPPTQQCLKYEVWSRKDPWALLLSILITPIALNTRPLSHPCPRRRAVQTWCTIVPKMAFKAAPPKESVYSHLNQRPVCLHRLWSPRGRPSRIRYPGTPRVMYRMEALLTGTVATASTLPLPFALTNWSIHHPTSGRATS